MRLKHRTCAGSGWSGGGGLIHAASSRCCFWSFLVSWQWKRGASPCLIHPSGLGAALAGTHTGRQRHWSTSEASVVPSSRMLNQIFLISESARVAGSAPIPMIQPRRQNNELLSHPFTAERSEFSLIARVRRCAVAKQNGLRERFFLIYAGNGSLLLHVIRILINVHESRSPTLMRR